jgi:hypothetical protein
LKQAYENERNIYEKISRLGLPADKESVKV